MDRGSDPRTAGRDMAEVSRQGWASLTADQRAQRIANMKAGRERAKKAKAKEAKKMKGARPSKKNTRQPGESVQAFRTRIAALPDSALTAKQLQGRQAGKKSAAARQKKAKEKAKAKAKPRTKNGKISAANKKHWEGMSPARRKKAATKLAANAKKARAAKSAKARALKASTPKGRTKLKALVKEFTGEHETREGRLANDLLSRQLIETFLVTDDIVVLTPTDFLQLMSYAKTTTPRIEMDLVDIFELIQAAQVSQD
jgi:hypothetical protein